MFWGGWGVGPLSCRVWLVVGLWARISSAVCILNSRRRAKRKRVNALQPSAKGPKPKLYKPETLSKTPAAHAIEELDLHEQYPSFLGRGCALFMKLGGLGFRV